MLPYNDLPIILVSAASESTAAKIISDIIDNEVTEVQCNENISLHRVWRIANKYYTADVCLRAFTDDEPSLPQLDNIEAHIVYLTEEECAGSDESLMEICEARVGRLGSAGQHADVRLLAAESQSGTLPDSLVLTATRLHLELVPLRLEPSHYHDDEEDNEDHGLTRVRAALHAHTWSGLKLSGAAAKPSSLLPYRERSPGSESAESGAEGEGVDEEGVEADAVERAEQFAEALGALRGAAEQCAGLGRAERALRAERLLAEFCRALGHRLDAC